MTEKLLLELIIILLGCLLALIAFLFRSHYELHKTLSVELDELQDQRCSCNESFATKDSVRRAHSRIDENTAEISELSTRVTRLEAEGGKRA